VRIAVLGGGPGGYVAALRAAQLGAQAAVIEQDEVGGACLNWGCIPTKSLIASSEAFHKAKHLSDFGIDLNGTVYPNIAKIMARKNSIVSLQVKGIRTLFKSWGVTLIEGRGRLAGPEAVEVEKKDGTKERVEADRIIIATGSRPAEIPLFPFDGNRILSSNDAVHISEIPRTLLIVGAGVIGSEFACLFSEFGTEVTMVEVLPRAVSTEDTEISDQIEREFKKKKIRLLKETGVTKVDALSDGVHTFLSNGKEIITDKVLVSVGRAYNSEGMGIEALGIAKGPRGEIIVNERMETNIPHIYAIGDVVGGMLLAHKASAEGKAAAANACGRDAIIDHTVIPSAIFTSPEIGSVGLREHQAIEKGVRVKTGRFLFRGIGKAHVIGEIAGFVKIVADADTDRIVGAHIIGPDASDLIHEAALAMRVGLKSGDIAGLIHAHPTLSEAVMEASEDLHGASVHVLKK
jgi:dihydrolipoamide dehydrogenase